MTSDIGKGAVMALEVEEAEGVFGLANVNFNMKMRKREVFVIDYGCKISIYYNNNNIIF